MVFQAECGIDYLMLPFALVSDIKIHKQDLAHFIILIDLICIFSVALFMFIIKKRQ